MPKVGRFECEPTANPGPIFRSTFTLGGRAGVEEPREIAMRAGADHVGLVAVDREVTLAPGARLQVGPTVVLVSIHGN